MTHSRPLGTVTGPNSASDPGSREETYGSFNDRHGPVGPESLTCTFPSASQHLTDWPPTAMTRLTRSCSSGGTRPTSCPNQRKPRTIGLDGVAGRGSLNQTSV